MSGSGHVLIAAVLVPSLPHRHDVLRRDFPLNVMHRRESKSPIHGKIISDLIVEGETSIPLEDYDPLRYDERGTRKAGPDRSGH